MIVNLIMILIDEYFPEQSFFLRILYITSWEVTPAKLRKWPLAIPSALDATTAQASLHSSDQDDLTAGVHRLHPPRERVRLDRWRRSW